MFIRTIKQCSGALNNWLLAYLANTLAFFSAIFLENCLFPNSDQKPPSAKFQQDLVEAVSARLPYPISPLAHPKEVTWSELMAWNSAEMPAPLWSSTRKPKGLLMALPNSSPPPLMGARPEEKWWTTLSNIGSGKRAIGNQALQTGPQVLYYLCFTL